jgi:hypothetical protein
MHTHRIYVCNARAAVEDIRRRLLAFPEVLELFVTGRPDVLVVVHTGRPRLGAWHGALRSAGYRVSSRRRAAPPPRLTSVRLPAEVAKAA